MMWLSSQGKGIAWCAKLMKIMTPNSKGIDSTLNLEDHSLVFCWNCGIMVGGGDWGVKWKAGQSHVDGWVGVQREGLALAESCGCGVAALTNNETSISYTTFMVIFLMGFPFLPTDPWSHFVKRGKKQPLQTVKMISAGCWARKLLPNCSTWRQSIKQKMPTRFPEYESKRETKRKR